MSKDTILSSIEDAVEDFIQIRRFCLIFAPVNDVRQGLPDIPAPHL